MKLHKFDPVSFVAGLFITAVGLVFLIPADFGDLLDFFGGIDDLATWIWPILFIAIGLAVVIPLFQRNDHQSDTAAGEDEPDQTL